MEDRGKRLAQLDASSEKFEVRATGDAVAIVDEWAVLPTPVLANLGYGIGRFRTSGGCGAV
jgi:hypothetical protein